VRPEGLGKLKEFIHLIGSRTRDLTSCSIVPKASMLLRAPTRSQTQTEARKLLAVSLRSVHSLTVDTCGTLMTVSKQPNGFSYYSCHLMYVPSEETCGPLVNNQGGIDSAARSGHCFPISYLKINPLYWQPCSRLGQSSRSGAKTANKLPGWCRH
jgi:hypothetical protein